MFLNRFLRILRLVSKRELVKIGDRFDRWEVIAPAEKALSGHRRWLCRCECGSERIVHQTSLRAGTTKSCGCLHTEDLIRRNTIHGHKKNGIISPEYTLWLNIKQRCFNPKNKDYAIYGGRGIVLCDAWRDDFTAFLAGVGPKPICDKRMSLDRINSDLGYEPGNVRWVDDITQARNKHNNHLLTFCNRTQTLTEWSIESGVKFDTIRQRIIAYNWSIKDSLLKPVGKLLTSGQKALSLEYHLFNQFNRLLTRYG